MGFKLRLQMIMSISICNYSSLIREDIYTSLTIINSCVIIWNRYIGPGNIMVFTGTLNYS